MGIFLTTNSGADTLVDDVSLQPLVDNSDELLTQTTTILSSSLDPSVYLQAVTFTAVVTGAAGTPTGIVQFFDGASSLGTGTLVSGTTTLTTPALTIGTHGITGIYSGDSTFAGSISALLTQGVYDVPVSARYKVAARGRLWRRVVRILLGCIGL